MWFIIIDPRESFLLFTEHWSGRKDGGGRTGKKRTESNAANVGISSNSIEGKNETEQFTHTELTGVVTVTAEQHSQKPACKY